jgi:hypothetical protein
MLSWHAQGQYYFYLSLRTPLKQREFNFVFTSDEVNEICRSAKKGEKHSLEANVNNFCKEHKPFFLVDITWGSRVQVSKLAQWCPDIS